MGNYIFFLTFNLHPFPDMGKGWRTDSKKTLAIAFCHIYPCFKSTPPHPFSYCQSEWEIWVRCEGFFSYHQSQQCQGDKERYSFLFQPYGDRLEWFMPPDKTLFLEATQHSLFPLPNILEQRRGSPPIKNFIQKKKWGRFLRGQNVSLSQRRCSNFWIPFLEIFKEWRERMACE